MQVPSSRPGPVDRSVRACYDLLPVTAKADEIRNQLHLTSSISSLGLLLLSLGLLVLPFVSSLLLAVLIVLLVTPEGMR